MDNMEHENFTEQEEKPSRKHRLPKFLTFFLILVVVLGIVVAAAYRDGTGFDVLRRFFTYGSAESESGTTGYSYDASAENRFAVLGDSMVVLSNTELQILDGKGNQTYSASVKMTAPALSIGGDCAVAYDIGGTQLFVVNQEGLLLSLTAEEDEPFFSATLNKKGWLAVTAQKKNYKGCVSVYNDQMKKVFDFNSSQRFVTEACVSDDCRDLAAVTLGQKDSVFISDVVLYDLSKTDPTGDYTVENGMTLSIGQISSKIVTVCDQNVTFANWNGKIEGTYAYDNEYLREYSLTGDDYVALLLNRYQSGSVGRLATVGTDGKEIASLDINDEILSVSAAGRYLAVLYTDRLVIYNEELQEYASLSGTDYAKSALMRKDGSALLISSNQASLFLP